MSLALCCSPAPTVSAAECGDGTVEAGEDCDDGNTADGDGCSSACTIEAVCGNNVLEPGEQCDDRNLVGGDGCSATCQFEFGGCDATGTWTVYGGVIQNFWTIIDDGSGDLIGALILADSYFGPVTGTRAGAGVMLNFATVHQPGFMPDCDTIIAEPLAGNFVLKRIRTTYCGDGAMQAGETCDDGNLSNDDGCPASCGYHVPPAACGDHIVQPGEACDDGNTVAGDGCTPECTIDPVCGNGAVESGEQCDDGNTAAGDGCGSTCLVETNCGDGVLEPGEQCDDGNTIDGDGCSAACVDEDTDDDGVRDDGDGSGVVGDHPCTGGDTAGCDDNCPHSQNADQADTDGDLVGDICDYNCNGLVGATLSGVVYRDSIGPGNGHANAYVFACTDYCCAQTTSDADGQYTLAALGAGSYRLYVFSQMADLLPAEAGPIVVAALATVSGVDVVLRTLQPLPPDTTLEPHRGDPDGPPVVYWHEPQTLTITGCPGGMATYQITRDAEVVRSGAMAEGSPGVYSAVIAALYPNHGYLHTEVALTCPDASTDTRSFDLYVDPSGVTRLVTGAAAAGATVTLLRADIPAGPFEVVAAGSAIMSPANRHNPDSTDPNGHFGWDVTPGYYVVRAQRGDCTVSTEVLTIPPAVLDLDLRFDCLCTAGALPGCLAAGASQLLLKSPGPAKQHGLDWKWLKGDTTGAGDLGDPLAGDPYALCLYDGAGQLAVQADAPPGGACRGHACWKSTARGFAYRDVERTPNGFSNLALTSGESGRGKVVAKASGTNLALPPLDTLTPPLRVQLQRGGGAPGQCWEATFAADTVRDQSAKKLKATWP